MINIKKYLLGTLFVAVSLQTAWAFMPAACNFKTFPVTLGASGAETLEKFTMDTSGNMYGAGRSVAVIDDFYNSTS